MAKDRLLFLISLGLLGVLAAFLFGKNQQIPMPTSDGNTASQQVKEQIIKVLVAQKTLNPGTKLMPNSYSWEEIAAEEVTPSFVIQNPRIESTIEEAVIVNEVPKGGKINRLDILWPQEANKNSNITKVLPLRPSKVAVSLSISKNTPLINYIKPGKNVEIIFSSKANIGFGQESLTLFDKIRVLTIGSTMESDEKKQKDKQVEVLLEMDSKEAKIFNYAQEAGTLTIGVLESGLSSKKEDKNETSELRNLLLESKSSLNFNSILATHMMRSLFPKVDVTITATPTGYIASGHITDPKVAEKINEVLGKLSEKGEKGFVDLMETDDGSVPVSEGKLSVLLELTEKVGIAHFLNPGMNIDLILTTKAASSFGTVTLPLLKNIKVLSVGKPGSRSKKDLPKEGPIDIILEMTPREAEIFTYGQQAGALSIGMTQDEPNSENTIAREESKELIELRDVLLTSRDDGTFNSLITTYMIHKLFPLVDVKVTATPKGYIASGKVNKPQVAEKIREILEKLSEQGERDFVDLLEVVPQQVLICVRVLEVDRNIKASLGINWETLYENADYSIALAAVFPRPLPTDPNYFLKLDNVSSKHFTLNSSIDMMRKEGSGKVLAEPNLTTVSGQPAHFFSGGEFPILIPQGGTLLGTVTVEYKQFGVILDFTPYVDLTGLITLHIVPEVSTIDEQNSVKLQGFDVPSLITRRVDTTVKLWPGQSYAIAGLLQYEKLARYHSLYCLHQLPIIGPLFRSKQFIERRTELMFVITPYLIYSEEAEKYTHYKEECFEETPFCLAE